MGELLQSAKIACYINGELYALVYGATWSIDTPRKAIFAVDSATPYELAPTTALITGMLRIYRQVRDGGLEGYGITQFPSDLLNEQYVSITLLDAKSDSVLFNANKCAVQSQQWEAPVKGIVTGSLSFQATEWSNEAA
jgi:hypothetical protein